MIPSAFDLDSAARAGRWGAQWLAASWRVRSVAIERCTIIHKVRLLNRMVDKRSALSDLGVPVRTYTRWERLVHGKPEEEWPVLLLPHWNPVTPAAEIHPEAWDWFVSDYLRASKPTFAACYRRLLVRAAEAGWGSMPHLKTFKRRVAKEIPETTRLLRREGGHALEQSVPAQRRDKSALHALAHVNADGHRFDVFVRWPMRHAESKPRIGRPILVAWQDIYSGKVLSWRLDETENSDSVRLAFASMLRDFGIPLKATVDNGHAFASKRMTGGVLGRHRFKFKDEEATGIYKSFGVEVHFALPYHGQSKPIERAFRDLCEDISKHPSCAGAYTGNAPHAKPHDYGTRAIDYEDFVRLVDQQIREHNARTGRRAEHIGGRSFDAVFFESLESDTTIVRRATEAQLGWLLLPVEDVRVGRDEACITLLGNRFFHPKLLQLRGRSVTVRFDPYDVRAGAWVFDGGTEPICQAECIAPVGFEDTEAARRDMRQRRALIRAEKEAAAAFGTVPAHQLAHPARDPKPTRPRKVVAANFGQPRPPVSTDAQRVADAADDLLLTLGRASREKLNRAAGRGK